MRKSPCSLGRLRSETQAARFRETTKGAVALYGPRPGRLNKGAQERVLPNRGGESSHRSDSRARLHIVMKDELGRTRTPDCYRKQMTCVG